MGEIKNQKGLSELTDPFNEGKGTKVKRNQIISIPKYF